MDTDKDADTDVDTGHGKRTPDMDLGVPKK
jgi:hypothetical protein